MTIQVNYHGSDTYRFSATEIDSVRNVDRFGYIGCYDTLTAAMQEMFAVSGQSPVRILARFIACQAVTSRAAQYIAKRLILERVEDADKLNLTNIMDLPNVLKNSGIDIWR